MVAFEVPERLLHPATLLSLVKTEFRVGSANSGQNNDESLDVEDKLLIRPRVALWMSGPGSASRRKVSPKATVM
jgi:hypothetical protein